MKHTKLLGICVLLFHVGLFTPYAFATIQDDAQARPVVELLPTRQAFEVEVAAIKKQSSAYDETSTRLKGLYEKAKEAYDTLRDQQRGGRNEQNDERKTYREAWERVRQLLREDAGEEALAAAVKEANAITDKLDQEEAGQAPDADDLDTRVDQSFKAMREAQEVYDFARRDAYDYARLLSSAESTLRRFDRDGVYASFVKEKQRVEAKIAANQAYAKQVAELKADQAEDTTHWEKRWADLTPAQRVIELERVSAQLEAQRNASRAMQEAHQAKTKTSLEQYNRRSEIGKEASSLRTKRSELYRKARDLVRAEAGAQEIEAVEQELDQTIAALAEKDAEFQEAYDRYLEMDAQTTAAYRAWKLSDKQVSHLYTRHREASRRVSADPEAVKNDPKQREIRAIREAWRRVTGQDVQWGTNPFVGQPVSSAGSITQDGPDLRFTYDGPGYHAQMHITNAGRSLHVFDDAGKVLYDGPVNHITHLKDFTQELYYLWEFLHTRVSVR